MFSLDIFLWIFLAAHIFIFQVLCISLSGENIISSDFMNWSKYIQIQVPQTSYIGQGSFTTVDTAGWSICEGYNAGTLQLFRQELSYNAVIATPPPPPRTLTAIHLPVAVAVYETTGLFILHCNCQLRCGTNISITSLPQVNAASPHFKLK